MVVNESLELRLRNQNRNIQCTLLNPELKGTLLRLC